jgi:hypothetical protein
MWWRDAFACGEYYGETTIGCMCACGSKMQVYLRILTKKKNLHARLHAGRDSKEKRSSWDAVLISCACTWRQDFRFSPAHVMQAAIFSRATNTPRRRLYKQASGRSEGRIGEEKNNMPPGCRAAQHRQKNKNTAPPGCPYHAWREEQSAASVVPLIQGHHAETRRNSMGCLTYAPSCTRQAHHCCN